MEVKFLRLWCGGRRVDMRRTSVGRVTKSVDNEVKGRRGRFTLSVRLGDSAGKCD